MARQTNKTALNRLEKTEYLVVSGKTQKPTVNDRLAGVDTEIFGDGSQGAPPAPDWNQLQEWGIAALEVSAEGVRETDRALQKTRVRLDKARSDRDEKVNLIAAAHRALRKSFAGTYGAGSLPLVGLESEPVRALVPVREQMRQVVTRMRDPQLVDELPPPLAGQRPIELEPVAQSRDEEIGDLEAKMSEIDELRKQKDEALIDRDRAFARNQRVTVNVGRVLEGVYRLAGLDELADRIRFNERSASRKPEASETPPADPDAPVPENPEPESPEPAQEGGGTV